ncbi:hypothetical protein LTR10_016207 [Elasticomyces elasticus]|uniref:Spermatogenesis-associated protein 20-like TRX domain-containing protein n=1 Tax=Exophiala sideris TaxID=1016849 RepID=A0ABR0JN95_9EURO|nr:hypothetical protein LTR10_016207 [Elasticomyces elasticus]KAK5037961.1 hypothetical protein LTS07_001428 [Exophiala sideris]KAK5043944.1 hypothetical protein LTR13_000298 [Exophiala sideris]KAK5067443.1 hypothetical protein LTR69_001430 [Exophiala sideris]KAK5182776.1 hypothetical protein LTR44_005167 [Eurotiomycetes sp. CCFEE 6388]
MVKEEPTLSLQNALANSSSPYLRAHKDNPVAWQEWSDQTIALAKQYQRLIFLSIGYNACHWCHVMERESFSTPEVAEILNKSFIPIKLDRESRPDLDDIYMNYVTATTGSGGWPLNVFLTPDLKPVFGGTYWPGPAPMTNMKQASTHDEPPVSFLDILHKMQDVWSTQREKCLQSSADITNQLRAFAAEGIHSHSNNVQSPGAGAGTTEASEPLELDLLDDALDHFITRYDPVNGGFIASPLAPKFPTPSNLQFLLRIGAAIAQPSTHTRFGFFSPVPGILGQDSCLTAASMSLHTLLAMARSALRDHLGYGFHRYSVTPDWNLPHFEKMMCDNAQLLACYCDAWALGRDPEILGTIYNLVEYFTNPDSPIVRSEGGWYASEDADSRSSPSNLANGAADEKREGAYYVWTLKELQTVLGERDASVVARHFGVKDHGNVPAEHDMHDEFLSQNVLHIQATPSVLAKEFGLAEDEIVRIIKSGRAKLLERRKTKREQPEVDTKVIASWNGLAIAALAKASNTLATIDKTRARACQEAAEKAAIYIRRTLYDDTTGRLSRTPESTIAFVDDYAYMVHANIVLYDLTLSQPYLDWAVKLQEYLDEHFASTTGGYFQAEQSSQQIIRLKPGTDSSLPSPNGTICINLLYLSSYRLEKQTEYIGKARAILDAFAVEIIQHPFLYVSLLSGMVMEQVGVKTLVVPMTTRDSQLRRLRGWGRTVVRDLVPDVMICTREGVCRPLKQSDLEDVDEAEEAAA